MQGITCCRLCCVKERKEGKGSTRDNSPVPYLCSSKEITEVRKITDIVMSYDYKIESITWY